MANLDTVQATAAPCLSVRHPTPYEVLAELFDPAWAANTHLCVRYGDSTNWTGFRVHERFGDTTQIGVPDDKDVYFAIGMHSRETKGRNSRFVVRDYLIVLDDVGVKSDRSTVDALEAFGIEPTMVVETSPGSFQYFFRLDAPVERLNPDQADRLALLELIRAKLGDKTGPVIYGDTAIQDTARYMRLPFGINSKDKNRLADGSRPHVRLDRWSPGTRVSLEQWADFLLGAGWQAMVASHQPGTKPASANIGGASGDRHASMDDVYVRLATRVGLDPHYLRPGVVGANCPNAAAHTNGDPTGFAFINPYRGHCQHEHCQHLSAADFMDMIEARYLDQVEAEIAAGELTRDNEGAIRNKAGDTVPATGRAWMAHDEFIGRSPLTVEDLVLAERAALRHQQRRAARHEKLRMLDRRFCLCPTIEGVVDLCPVAAESVHFNVYSKAHFKTLFDREKVDVGGAPKGAASLWLIDPTSPTYEAIGCWPIGHEPPHTLNLWKGIDGADVQPPRGAVTTLAMRYLDEVVAGGRADVLNYVLNWLAWKLQNPMKKHGVNLVLIGQQGTGKSTLGNLMISMLGPKFAMGISNEQHLLGHFNAHLEGKLFLLVDEALFGKNPAIAGRYKALTTEESLVVERKGIDARTVQNMLSLLICSNSLAGVPIEPGDRRATVVEVSSSHRNDTGFFRALWAEWTTGGREAFIHLLLQRDVSTFEPRICLSTPEKAEIAETTADAATRYWLDRVNGWNAPNGKSWTQPILILNEELEADYAAWAEMTKSPRLGRSELSRRIGELCPARTKARESGGGRRWGNSYPSREECQRAAYAALGGDHGRPPDR